MTITDFKDVSPFAALIAVVYLLGVQLIKGWQVSERERTAAMAKSLEAITGALTSLGGKIDTHHTADIESHAEMATQLGRIEKAQDLAQAQADWNARAPTLNGGR